MTLNKNWNGIQYEWFEPIDWKTFVKRIEGDMECKNHTPFCDWQEFWKTYFVWKDYCGEQIEKNIPSVIQYKGNEEWSEELFKAWMITWSENIKSLYNKYRSAVLNKKDTQKYIDSLLYLGWTMPKEPYLLQDITKNISEHYFEPMTHKKIDRTPFCTKPMIIKQTDNEIESFYFTVPANINKAYIEAEVDGVMKRFDNEAACKAVTKKKYFVSGGVSDTSVDLDGERMSLNAIKSMEESAKNGEIPLRNAHKKEWDSDLGTLKSIKITDEKTGLLECSFELNDFEEDPFARKLWHSIQKGKKIGFSIGGIVNKMFWEHDSELNKEVKVYDDIALKEVSVTGNPANTNTFIYAISKAMKELEKKPLRSGARGKLSNSQFAYISPDGKTRKLPLNDANHTRNAMARFNQTDLPADAKAKAWRKILAAARKFGIKVNKPAMKSKTDQIDVSKFQGVKCFFEVLKDYGTEQAIWQMRNDLKNHMDNDDKEMEELTDILDEIKEKLEELEEHEDEEEGENGETEGADTPEIEQEDEKYDIKEDFKLLLQIMGVLSTLEYPKDAKMPEKYYDVAYNLPIESYIVLDGDKMLPHHNADYTLNKEWLQYQLKRVMDGEIYVDLDDYLEILLHLQYHTMENNIKKSTEAEAQPVETPTVTEETPNTVTAEETPKAEEVVAEKPAESVETHDEQTTSEATQEVKTEVTPEPTPVVNQETEVKTEEVAPVETESEKKMKQEIATLNETLKSMAKVLEEVQNTPLYKAAKETNEVVNKNVVTGKELSDLTGLYFAEKSYTEDEARAEIERLSPYNTYTYKTVVRHLFQNK